MDKNIENPQAFPVPMIEDEEKKGYDVNVNEEGMTLRDWFAGKALQDILANNRLGGRDDRIAHECYNMADAMLKEREHGS